jgi:hypothetical protein
MIISSSSSLTTPLLLAARKAWRSLLYPCDHHFFCFTHNSSTVILAARKAYRSGLYPCDYQFNCHSQNLHNVWCKEDLHVSIYAWPLLSSVLSTLNVIMTASKLTGEQLTPIVIIYCVRVRVFSKLQYSLAVDRMFQKPAFHPYCQ